VCVCVCLYCKQYTTCKTVYHDCFIEGRHTVIWLHVLASLEAVIRSTRKYILRESDKKCHPIFVSELSFCRQRLLKPCVSSHYAALHSRKLRSARVWLLQCRYSIFITISDWHTFLMLLVLLRKWHVRSLFSNYICLFW
jgi:hypothetical protein